MGQCVSDYISVLLGCIELEATPSTVFIPNVPSNHLARSTNFHFLYAVCVYEFPYVVGKELKLL